MSTLTAAAAANGLSTPESLGYPRGISKIEVTTPKDVLAGKGDAGTYDDETDVLTAKLTPTNKQTIVKNGKYLVEFTLTMNGLPVVHKLEGVCTTVPANPQENYIFKLDKDLRESPAEPSAATPYEISIAMSVDTSNKLRNAGFKLYAFKAVQSSSGGGTPTVWFSTLNYSTQTVVSWFEQYQAYTTTRAIIPNGIVTADFAVDAALGQQLVVNNVDGTGTVQNGGPAKTAIGIQNDTSTEFSCGISQVVTQDDGTKVASPLCAFPLYGNNLDVMAPIEKVLLMFTTAPLNTGSVVEQAYSPGFLIDLTSDNVRNVDYDINKGWSTPGSNSWAQQVPANANLVPLLIETPAVSRQPLARRRLLVY